MNGKTIEIKYGDLYVTGYVGEEEVNFPIGKIPEMEEAEVADIHGHLTITIGGEQLLHLGFWGDDDVCFNEWTQELTEIVNHFSKYSRYRYLYCSGEQGEPAFEFCREDDLVYISYVDPEVYYAARRANSGGITTSSRVGKGEYICNYKDFDVSVRTFLEQFKQDLYLEMGDFASIWWQNIVDA